MANDLYGFGIVEKVIPEPESFTDAEGTKHFFHQLRRDLSREIKHLSHMSRDTLLSERYEKYRKIGRYESDTAPTPAKARRVFFGRK